jgi:hypothetical protein
MITTCSSSTDKLGASAKGENGADQDANDSWFGEMFYTSPIGASPKVPDLNKNPSQSCDPNPCSFRTETIWFVNSRFVSTDFYQGKSEECEPRGFSWFGETHVLPLGGSAPVSFKELTGDDGWEAYNFAVQEASYNLQENGANCEVFTERSKVLEDTNWTLRRDHGKWIAVLRWQIGAGACEYLDNIDLALPTLVTDYDTLHPSWPILEKQIKDLRDAFTSPAGNLLLARTDTSVAIYATSADKVGAKLLELPGGRIVMAQWAEGKYADQWRKQLSAWQLKGLPPLVLQPEQSPRP